MAGSMSMTCNSYSTDWTDESKDVPCEIGAECTKQKTKGHARFYVLREAKTRRQLFAQKHCCLPCAMSECTRLGLQGALTITRIR